jgi:hypothetical protein
MPSKSPPAKRGRGRPAHQPTAATRRQVSVAAGAGMRHVDIAIALGLSRETLEKHYQAELSQAAQARRMDVLMGLYNAAKKGSSAAAARYLRLDPELAVPPLSEGDQPLAPTPAPVAVAPKADKIGKKEQAQADAVTAAVGTEWADLLKPPAAPLQ